MNTNRRKVIGTTAALLTTGLAGCNGITGDILSNEETSARESGSNSNQNSPGSVSLEFDKEDADEPFVYYELKNNTPDILLLGTIMYIGSDNNGDSVRKYKTAYRVPPNQSTVFRFPEDIPDVELVAEGTWTESEYRPPSSDVDVIANPTGTSEQGTLTGFGETPEISAGAINYTIPNPTNITGNDIREINTDSRQNFLNDYSNNKAGSPDLEESGDKFVFTSTSPIWASSFNVAVNGTSDSQEFTFGTQSQPDVDIKIKNLPLEDGLENPEITFTADSEVPIMNPIIAIVGKGPSIENDTQWFVPKPGANISGDNRVLITSAVGQDRIGTSETYTVEAELDIDYPLENEDTLGIGVVSGYGSFVSRYPVTYQEGTVADLS